MLFLDDDSYPRAGSIEQMITHFRGNPKLGAGGFTVHLPDGRQESAALPHVFVGCGVGFRRKALEQSGGLDRALFMQAEEYDLCFRLMACGWEVEVFDDLHVDHLKSPQARMSERTCYYDTRNNLIVAGRYIPDEHESAYREDVMQRYRWIAESQGHALANQNGERAGLERYPLERDAFADRRLTPEKFETFFRFEEVETRMRELHAGGINKIVLADLGKNVYPFVCGAVTSGVHIIAIADDRFAKRGRTYRGIPVVKPGAVDLNTVDAIVVSNMSPTHAVNSELWWKAQAQCLVFSWFSKRETAPLVLTR